MQNGGKPQRKVLPRGPRQVWQSKILPRPGQMSLSAVPAAVRDIENPIRNKDEEASDKQKPTFQHSMLQVPFVCRVSTLLGRLAGC